jgi:hypothetical protein
MLYCGSSAGASTVRAARFISPTSNPPDSWRVFVVGLLRCARSSTGSPAKTLRGDRLPHCRRCFAKLALTWSRLTTYFACPNYPDCKSPAARREHPGRGIEYPRGVVSFCSNPFCPFFKKMFRPSAGSNRGISIRPRITIRFVDHLPRLQF